MKGRTLKASNASFQLREKRRTADGDHQNEVIDTPDQSETDEHTHGIHVGRSPGHELTGLGAVMKGVTQSLEMVVKQIAQVIGHPLGKKLGKVALPVAQDTAQYAGAGDG